ncbi:CPBP family intramembrane glutamic endopeptidase [Anaeromicropila herbilytica]|uniref:CAAX prenyl protease 2/Lysostaphin resistance protein A-like domain-containing protein n=1 Tax=Anaeromicropila herbilytica TaxID=2785025 RepID=A0A7R7EQG6_9FIRM|nr:type II CAAX endopeptidase family protein [Anaeromicropila herbilytica]BCN32896.1 hypothetical protein bsdtb5_41910 [Anaeromicropila herbilytica]
MNQTRKFILKRPVIFSLAIIIISVALTSIPLSFLFDSICGQQEAEYIVGILEQTVVSVILILFLKKIDYLKKAGFQRKCNELWILWPMICFILLNASDYLGSVAIDKSKPLLILLFVLVYLSTGLFEETLCRGVVFTVMLEKWGGSKRGYYSAILLSSLIFGLTHFIHYILGDSSFLYTVTQVIYASFVGVFFCASMIRNRSIYPAMLLHGLFDIAGSLKEIAVNGGIDKSYKTTTLDETVVCVIILLPLFVYGLFIIRKEYEKHVISQKEE